MLTGESEARARIERAAAQAEDNLRRAQRMNGELAEVRSVGHSRDGGAEVTVSASGVLVDLHVTAKLAQRPAEEIRAAILQANAEACVQAQQQVREVSGRWLGERSESAAEMDRHFGSMLDQAATPPEDGPRGSAGSGVLR